MLCLLIRVGASKILKMDDRQLTCSSAQYSYNSESYMKYLVWGEDALSMGYIHFIPTGLFDLYLVVSDQDVQRASNEIMQSLPYKICSALAHFLPTQVNRGHFHTWYYPKSQFLTTNSTWTTQTRRCLYPSSVTVSRCKRYQPLSFASTFCIFQTPSFDSQHEPRSSTR